MSAGLLHFDRNTRGRDFAVGDIHGCFTRLQAALDAIGFDPAVDRLFSVGDLVDRGPESMQVLEWLDKPWFHAVQGNHDEMAIRWGKPGCMMDVATYAANGGTWNIANDHVTRADISTTLACLPLAIEVETSAGLVGIVHADCPFLSLTDFREALVNEWAKVDGELRRMSKTMIGAMWDQAMWSRTRISALDCSPVQDVLAVVVGHNPLMQALTLGNVVHIDTMGWRPQGAFTLLDLDTLQPAQPVARAA